MTQMGDRDPGLQPERTVLAWRRTSLSLIALCGIGVKVMADAGGLIIGLAVLGAVLGLATYVASTLRYRRHMGSGVVMPRVGGGPAMMLATVTLVVLGMAALGAIAVGI